MFGAGSCSLPAHVARPSKREVSEATFRGTPLCTSPSGPPVQSAGASRLRRVAAGAATLSSLLLRPVEPGGPWSRAAEAAAAAVAMGPRRNMAPLLPRSSRPLAGRVSWIQGARSEGVFRV